MKRQSIGLRATYVEFEGPSIWRCFGGSNNIVTPPTMDRGKRAMTDAELEVDRQARRPQTTSDDSPYLQPYSQVDSSYDPVYRALTPYTVRIPVVAPRPPFVTEEQNVENIVVQLGKQLTTKPPFLIFKAKDGTIGITCPYL